EGLAFLDVVNVRAVSGPHETRLDALRWGGKAGKQCENEDGGVSHVLDCTRNTGALLSLCTLWLFSVPSVFKAFVLAQTMYRRIPSSRTATLKLISSPMRQPDIRRYV